MTHAFRFAAIVSLAVAGLTALPPSARAQSGDEIKPDDPELVAPKSNDPKERAKVFYTRGRKNYDLGRFRRAIALYEKAYEELPDAAFLFNIAQAYRMLDDCKQALFFYKRYISVEKNIPTVTKKEIDGHISVLTECVKQQEDIRNRPPGGTLPPTGGGGDGTEPGGGTGGGNTGGGDTGGGNTGGGNTGGGNTGGGNTGGGNTGGGNTGGDGGRVGDAGGGGGPIDDGGDGDDDGDDGDGATGAPPKMVALFARGGGARVAAGDTVSTFVAAAGLTAGYPIAVNPKLGLDVGAVFQYTPVPWNDNGARSGTMSLMMVGAHLGATYTVAPKIGLRGEVDVGALLVSGLDEGNPFTENAMAATGALSMLSWRVGLAAEYALNPKLSLVVTPIAFSFSPGKERFVEGNALTRLEFLAGLGYRM